MVAVMGYSRDISVRILQFYNKGLVKLPADIFKLVDINQEQTIGKWDGWGEQSVDNLFSSIEKSKKINMDRFIYSLGIRHVGVVTADILANYFKNIIKLITRLKC